MVHAFDEDTALEPVPGADPADPASGQRFTAGMSHRWDTVGPPNGGFLLALAARALARTVPFPDPVTLTGHFLRPSRHPPVELHVDSIRTGSTHATATGRPLPARKAVHRPPATLSELVPVSGPTAR